MKALISSICFIAAIAAHATIDSDSVVGVWLFDEGEGRRTDERSMKDRHHIWLGKHAKWTNGKFGSCLDISNSSASFADFAKRMPTEEITITIWTKNHHVGTRELFTTSTTWWEDVNKENWIISAHLPWNGNVQWRFGSPYIDLRAELPIKITNTLRWRHWAFVHSRRDNIMAIYHNGELFASMNDSTKYILPTKLAGFRLGRNGEIRGLQGAIDEFGIFNRRLTQEEIQTVMTRGLVTALAVEPTHKLASTWGEIKS